MRSAATSIAGRSSVVMLGAALILVWCVGILGRGYWTPDEPREADIAWRMSWQDDRAVPLLAGEAFCEKPPLTYWLAAAAIDRFGKAAWVARLPNLLYAVVTALAVGLLGRRSAGPLAGVVAAAAVSTFLLTYQVAIWLATDAPLMASVAVALLGLHVGFYAVGSRQRLSGYSLMHAALALGFLSKSAVAWMVPALTLATLIIWERRWRELWRWELHAGLAIQAVVILTWVAFVYAAPDGPGHLKVFFWNNLVGRFAHVDAPEQLQYTTAHRNSPGKYLIELPLYLWPWTLLVAAAVLRAWRGRGAAHEDVRSVRFALAAFVPTVAVLSIAATARNIYLAPALPGLALLVGWWAREATGFAGTWDVRAVRATGVLLLLAVVACIGAVTLVAWDSWDAFDRHGSYIGFSAAGLAASAVLALMGISQGSRRRMPQAMLALMLSYCALLTGPAGQLYRRVDAWQDLESVGRALARDAADRPLMLYAPDETTRAIVDLYARPQVNWLPGPVDAATTRRLRQWLLENPRGAVVTQLPGAGPSPAVRALARTLGMRRLPAPPDAVGLPEWSMQAGLTVAHAYSLPNGRRYALLETHVQ